jgi:Zn-finger in Ran binding protein and others
MIREKVWTCTDCGTKGIAGRFKECPCCGAPRGQAEVTSSSSGAAVSVVDPVLLALALAGPDWFCTHCSASNKGTEKQCLKCGAPRYGESSENHPAFPQAHLTAPTMPTWSGDDDSEDHATVINKPPVPPPLRRTVIPASPPPPEDPPFGQEPERSPFPLWPFMALLLLLLFCGGLWWAFSIHPVNGTVASQTWQRVIQVDTWMDVEVSGWKHQKPEVPRPHPLIPGRPGMTLIYGSCEDRQFDTEKVKCGSHLVCVDTFRTDEEEYACTKSESYSCGETCTDLGNGFEDCVDKTCYRDVPDTCKRQVKIPTGKNCDEVVDYCDVPIMKPWCDFQTQDWRQTAALRTQGTGTELFWDSSLELKPLQRATFTTHWKVIGLLDDGDQIELGDSVSGQTPNLVEYQRWTPGTRFQVDKTNLGTISGEWRPL